ncbi:hypothetical protein [Halomonas salina]|uniref:Uncharacterized protein n=1 Tax=Halomonas salina TaxID=42565 RepID=A0ABR4WVZ8_9GAMM|nr:hypothetical protein [Halomonas salina]KGE78924.1 hypothetical protein FP66_01165 [Halomonas salina]
MINTIQARVIGAMRYSMDNGVKGAKLTLMNEADAGNDNRVGFEVATISAPYEILDQLRPLADKMPCNLEIDAEMRTSQGKMTMHAIAVRQPTASGHPQAAPADSKQAAKS